MHAELSEGNIYHIIWPAFALVLSWWGQWAITAFEVKLFPQSAADLYEFFSSNIKRPQ